MKITFIVTAAIVSVLPSLSVSAQGFDRNVEVTKDFNAVADPVSKQSLGMTVPDSLTVFDLTFDYSVFSSPYVSAYSFKPYLVKFLPAGSSYDGSTLYCRVGCGWPFDPQATIVWSPRTKGSTSISAFCDFAGFEGDYHSYHSLVGSSSDTWWLGYDFDLALGASLEKRLSGSVFSISAEGDAMELLDETGTDGHFCDLRLETGIRSLDGVDRILSYDVTLRADMVRDYASLHNLHENRFSMNGSLSPTVDPSGARFWMDFDLGCLDYSGAVSDAVLYYVTAVPRTAFKLGKVDMSAGLKAAFIDRVHFYPDIRADLRLLRGKVDVYASVSGGDEIHDYASFKRENHFFSSSFAPASSFTSYSRTLKSRAGVGGCVKSFIQFDIHGGYDILREAPLYGIDAEGGAHVRMCDYSRLYAGGSYLFKFGPVVVDGSLDAGRTDGLEDAGVFDLPGLTTSTAVTYSLRDRLSVKVSLGTVSERDIRIGGAAYALPASFNLCFRAEYRLPRGLSLWVKGFNMLDNFVEIAPMTAERGIDLTAGVCVDL